jgi:hypothetical protein
MATVDVYLATGTVYKQGHRRSAPPSFNVEVDDVVEYTFPATVT